jgi:hypothetical protein
MSTPHHEPLMPPETIWLQIGEDEPGIENKSFSEFRDEVTWCWHKINDNDLEYRLVAEGVAAPLEPTPLTLQEFAKSYIEKLNATAPKGTQYFIGQNDLNFAEAYAAAVSKNLEEKLSEIINPIFDEDAQKWTLKEKLESVVRLDKLTMERIDELEKSEAELEKEIAALRETK